MKLGTWNMELRYRWWDGDALALTTVRYALAGVGYCRGQQLNVLFQAVGERGESGRAPRRYFYPPPVRPAARRGAPFRVQHGRPTFVGEQRFHLSLLAGPGVP